MWAPVGQDFAHLTNWRFLGKVCTTPERASPLIQALRLLADREGDR
ncbi:hypothetical protein ACFVH0_00960 [Streptomyces sp. NPDC127117]